MALKRYLGIKFPLTDNNQNGLFIDLASNSKELIKSNLMHLLFTKKGDRLRMPDFGTNLLQFIFQPKDNTTIVGIKLEIQESVRKYIPNVIINDLKVENTKDNEKSELSNGYQVTVDYYISDLKVSDTIVAAIGDESQVEY